MTRAGFGGSGDYSGLFSNLYSSTKSNKDAQQAADDQNAYDQWSNGLSSDDQWLQYIQGRIDATAGQPKEQQKWVDNLRQYSVVISDNKAEAAYKAGGSINDLIAYYQTRLSALNKDSNQARDVQLHVSDLMDQRASDNISDGSQKIIDGINKGTKTYTDLQNFLTAARVSTRANSDLQKSLDKQIQQVKDQVRSNALEGSFEKLQYQYDAGKMTGRAYASNLRTMAQQFKNTDTKRYYQLLEAAVAFDKRPGYSGGGSGGGGSSVTAASRATKKAQNATIDSIQAKRDLLQAQIKQFDSSGGKFGSSGFDPSTGAAVVFTPQKIHELDSALLHTFDQLGAAYTAKGDKSAAANAMKSKSAYVSTGVVLHNTMSADDQSRELLTATNKILSHAAANADPTAAMGALRGVAKDWQNFANGLTQNKTTSAAYRGNIHARLPAEGGDTTYSGAKGPLDRVQTDFAGRSAGFASALAILTKPGVTDEEASAAIDSIRALEGTGGGAEGGAQTTGALSTIAKGIVGVHANEQGLQTGDVTRVVQDGKIQFVRQTTIGIQTLDPNGNLVNVQKKVPDVNVDNQKTKLVDILMDINGVPTKVQAVAQQADIPGFNAWTTKKAVKLPDGTTIPAGKLLTDGQVKALGKDFQNAVNGGSIQAGAAMRAWNVVVPGYTDGQGVAHPGETWVQDSGTNLWYKGNLPLRGVQTDANGMVRIDANGNAMADWRSFASTAGVPAPYIGSDPKAAQNMVNQGVLGDVASGISGRGVDGKVGAPAPDLGMAYYNPFDVAQRDPSQRDSWWVDEQRQNKADQQKAQLVAQQRQAQQHQDNFMQANLDPGEFKKYQQGQVTKDISAVADTVMASPLGQLAKAFGINIGGTPDKKNVIPATPAPQISQAQKLAKLGELGLPKPSTASAPKVGLAPTAPSYTGPTVKAQVDLKLPAQQPTFNPKLPPDDRPAPKPTTAPVVKPAPVKTPVYKAPAPSSGQISRRE